MVGALVGAPWWLAADPAKLSSFASFPLSTAALEASALLLLATRLVQQGAQAPDVSLGGRCLGIVLARTALSHFFSFT